MQIKTKKIFKQAYAINGISEKVVDWGLKKAKRNKTKNDRAFFMGYERNENIVGKANELVNVNRFNLCFFGTLGNQFQFDKLLEIAKRLTNEDVDVYVCGIGPQYDRLKNESKNIMNFKMLNWLDKQELQYVLMNSKIGVAVYKPTFDFQMGASNKFAEYLSYGLPIILTSGGFMGELIDRFDCGISSNSIDEIINYILSLKNNEKKYKQKSQNAYELFKNKFNAKIVYSELVNYLEENGK